MKLVCFFTFALKQKISLINNRGEVIKCIECALPEVENNIIALCSNYEINTIFLKGGKTFTKKIANDLSLRVDFDQNKTKIIAD